MPRGDRGSKFQRGHDKQALTSITCRRRPNDLAPSHERAAEPPLISIKVEPIGRSDVRGNALVNPVRGYDPAAAHSPRPRTSARSRERMRSPPEADGPSLSCRAHSTSAMPAARTSLLRELINRLAGALVEKRPEDFGAAAAVVPDLSRRNDHRRLERPSATDPRNATSVIPGAPDRRRAPTRPRRASGSVFDLD